MKGTNNRRLPHRASSFTCNIRLLYAIPGSCRPYQHWHPWHSLTKHLSDEECETPCTYTECILSVFLSGIPSVYVTGGYTERRWIYHQRNSSDINILRAINYQILKR